MSGCSVKNPANHERFVYLDYQATTPCDPRVLETMLPYFTEDFGNPHSSSHVFGWRARDAVEQARENVAKVINADTKEIVFTSGATESNNLAIQGIAQFYKNKKNHIITCATEHKCVLDSCRHLEAQGFEITYVPVKDSGIIDLDTLKRSIKDSTILVSVMAVNNEIGVIQPIKEIGKICRERGVFFHTDAAQAIGKIEIDVKDMCIDLLSISGHKIYGPKGIGALYVGRHPRVRLQALIHGGGQERGMRSGTLPTPLCVGLGRACELAKQEMAEESKRIQKLRDTLYTGITSQIDEVYVNGDLKIRVPGNLNISFAYVEGEGLMGDISDLCVSSGSACTSESLEPSYVLRSLGVSEDLAHTSLRFGIGRFTTEEEIHYTISRVVEAVKRLRDMSPLYEMAKEGIDINSIQWDAH